MNIDNLAEGQWKRDKAGQEMAAIYRAERIIVRKIDGLNRKDIPALVEVLRQRTSVKNPDDSQKHYSVENPMVDGVEQPGVWRCVTIRGIEDPAVGPAGTIQQVLAFGWATSISWIEARLDKGLKMQPEGASDYKFLTVIFPNIATTSLDTLAETLSGHASFADPVIYGEPYSGTWYNSGVNTEYAKDGSGIISLELSIPYRDIPFQVSATSSDAVVSTRQQLGLTTQTPEPVANVAGQIKTQELQLNKDSSKDVVTKKDVGVAQEHTIKVVSPAGVTTVSEKTVQVSELPDPTSEKGKIKRIVNRISRYFNRYETTEELTVPTDQTLTLVNRDYSGTTTTVKHTENPTDLTAKGLERGKIKRQEAERTEAGNQKTTESTEVPANQRAQLGVADVFVESAQQTDSQVEWENDADLVEKVKDILAHVRVLRSAGIPAFLELANGEAGEITVRENEAGNKEVALRLDTTKTTTSTEVDEKDVFSTKAVVEETGADAKAGVAAFSAGVIKTVVNKWMRFKSRYLTTTTTETAVARSILKAGALGATTGTDVIVERGELSYTQMLKYYNATSAPTIAASEISGNKSVRIDGLEINRFGRFSYTKLIKSNSTPGSGSWNTTGGLYWLPFGYNSDGSLYSARQYRRNFSHTLSFHLTLAAAASAANGGMQGSSVYRIGDYLYVAHKITEGTPTQVGTATFGTAY